MGLEDGHSLECSFNEPQGICSLYKREIDKTVVYLADTNNHCLRYVDYDSGKVHTMKLSNVPEIEISVNSDRMTASSSAKAGGGGGGGEMMDCEDDVCRPRQF